jgi:phosphorylcholine metabolism protein LicD
LKGLKRIIVLTLCLQRYDYLSNTTN